MKEKKLRVWHIPQVPGEAFIVPVTSIEEAVKVMEILAMYDQFQYQENIKGDFSNVQGLEEYNEEDCEWQEWYSPDVDDLRYYLDENDMSEEPLNLRQLNNIKF